MKKIIYALFVALAFTSCEKDIDTAVYDPNNEKEEVLFTLSVDDVDTGAVKSRTETTKAYRYIMEVWNATGDTVVNCFGANLYTHHSENDNGIFYVTLDKTVSYTILFWADDNSGATYNATALKSVSLNSGKSIISDSYFARHQGIIVNDTPIALKRAVTDVRLYETGLIPLHNIMITYDGYSAFNIARESVVDSTESFSHEFSKDDYVTTGEEKLLGSFFAFADDSEEGTVIDFTVEDSNTGDTKLLAGVLLQSNKITSISGHFEPINISVSRIINLQSLDSSYMFTVSDRNAGVDVPKESVALNYSNDTLHVDNVNSLFQGDYYTWDEAIAGENSDTTDICPSGWRLPNVEELEVIVKAMQFSDSKAYLSDSDGNRCYFPLSGRSNTPSSDGYYWSSTEFEEENAEYLDINASNSFVNKNRKLYGFSVRCVKTVTKANF